MVVGSVAVGGLLMVLPFPPRPPHWVGARPQSRIGFAESTGGFCLAGEEVHPKPNSEATEPRPAQISALLGAVWSPAPWWTYRTAQPRPGARSEASRESRGLTALPLRVWLGCLNGVAGGLSPCSKAEEGRSRELVASEATALSTD